MCEVRSRVLTSVLLVYRTLVSLVSLSTMCEVRSTVLISVLLVYRTLASLVSKSLYHV